MISFTVPGEPVALGRPRVSVIAGRPRIYTPAESVAHKDAWQWAANAAGVRCAPKGEPLGLDLVFCYGYPASWSQKRIVAELELRAASKGHFGAWKATRPDVDNLCKLGLDSLNGVAWFDDGQVVELRAVKVFAPVSETRVRIWTERPVMGRWWTA